MQVPRAWLSRGFGCTICSFSMTVRDLRFAILLDRRSCSSCSQAALRSSIRPSSATELMCISVACVSSTASSTSFFSSAGRSSYFSTSRLVQTRNSGLPANSGWMLRNSESCSSMVYVHCPLRSMKYRMAACRGAMAVIDCISIVLRSSSGWSRMPGVSITCQRM